MAQVTFVDTSVLCNLLPVPHMDQDRETVLADLKKIRLTSQLILPITTVIETGNHIAQVANGAARWKCAQLFEQYLRLTVAGKAPWTLHHVTWDGAFLEALLAGADTGTTLAGHAKSQLGCGDLSILVEVASYRARTSGVKVAVWTLDGQLSSYCETPPR